MGVSEAKVGGKAMKLCEMCMARLIRQAYGHVHINIEQTPDKHYFCSKECKRLWVEYVRDHGVPPAYVEVFKY